MPKGKRPKTVKTIESMSPCLVRYSEPTRIGNWYEDNFVREEQFLEFQEKKEKHETNKDKIFRLFARALKEIPMPDREGPLRYGDSMMLVAEDITLPNAYNGIPGVAVTGLVEDNQIYTFKYFLEGTVVGGSVVLMPNRTNTFKIVGDTPDEHGKILTYGHQFFLSPVESANPMSLYLGSENPTFTTQIGKSGHPLVKFTTNTDRNSAWMALPLDPNCDVITVAAMGNPVMPNTSLAINHCASNMNLSAEIEHWSTKFLGEVCEITTFTHGDRKKTFMPQNVWKMVNKSYDVELLKKIP